MRKTVINLYSFIYQCSWDGKAARAEDFGYVAFYYIASFVGTNYDLKFISWCWSKAFLLVYRLYS
jgi:hypothetical protein